MPTTHLKRGTRIVITGTPGFSADTGAVILRRAGDDYPDWYVVRWDDGHGSTEHVSNFTVVEDGDAQDAKPVSQAASPSQDQFFPYKGHEIRVVSDGITRFAEVFEAGKSRRLFAVTSITAFADACRWVDREELARFRVEYREATRKADAAGRPTDPFAYFD